MRAIPAAAVVVRLLAIGLLESEEAGLSLYLRLLYIAPQLSSAKIS